MQTGDESTASGASIPIGIEAARINEVLKAKYYDSDGVNWWWNTANSHLVGKTPHQVWLSEIEPTDLTIELVHNAARAASPMGRAL
jgi:hypothetical protein